MEDLISSKWNQQKAEDLLIFYTKSIVNGGILNILNDELDKRFKNNVVIELKHILSIMLNGYKTYNYDLMIESITKLSELYDYINKYNKNILEEGNNERGVF